MTRIANTEQYEAWNGDTGQRWVVDPDRRDQVVAPVADVLLAAAGLQPGESVLDLGCGCGATTLTAAAAVGSDGSVTGIDLSAPMLDVARKRAAAAHAANISLVHGDAQTHPLDPGAFDVAISRFGTMFFADPVAAFTTVRRALRPSGRLCCATWQPLGANAWLTVPGAALLRYGSLPEIGAGPGMFAQADPERVTRVLTEAGYCDIVVRPATVTLTLGTTADEATAHLADSGVGRAVLATVAQVDTAAALDAVRAVLADHLTAEGVQLDAAIWIVSARRPR